MIESWGKAFSGSKYSNFTQTYNDLRKQGLRFPVPLKDEVAPVFTPIVSSLPTSPGGSKPIVDSALKAALENVSLLRDMLNASDPRDDLRKNDIVQQLLLLVKTCQAEILSRISASPDQFLMAQLLEANDELTSILNFYDGLLKGTAKREVKAVVPAKPVASELKTGRDSDPDDESGTFSSPRSSYELDCSRY
jgi:hypothetical protein